MYVWSGLEEIALIEADILVKCSEEQVWDSGRMFVQSWNGMFTFTVGHDGTHGEVDMAFNPGNSSPPRQILLLPLSLCPTYQNCRSARRPVSRKYRGPPLVAHGEQRARPHRLCGGYRSLDVHSYSLLPSRVCRKHHIYPRAFHRTSTFFHSPPRTCTSNQASPGSSRPAQHP